MPKVTGPLFSVDAKGTLADILTYQGGFGKHRAQKKPAHRDTFSAPQLIERLLFLEGRDHWSSLSTEDKATYNSLGHKQGMTGYNYVIKEFKKGRIRGGCRLFPPMQEGQGTKVYDRSGYGNDGEIHGATWEQLPSGLWVLSFNGTDAYVDCGDISTSNWQNLTVESWLKWDGSTMDSYRVFLYKGYSSDVGSHAVHFNGSLLVQNGNGDFYLDSNGDLPSNQWAHYVYKYDQSAGKEYILVNGIKKGEQARSGNIPQNYDSLQIVRADKYHFSSLIDGVRIYNEAKSEKWIRERYQLTKAFFQ